LVLLKRAYFVFQTPEFCIIICFGSILCYLSVILLLPDTLTNGMCWAHLWLFGMGFWAVYAAILLKNFRIFWVMSNAAKLKIAKVSLWEILAVLGVFVVFEGVYQACWDGIIQVRPFLDYANDNTARTYTIYCAGNKWMWLGSVLVRVLLLIASAVIAYMSKGLKKEQNYSKETALVIYTSCIILIVGIPIGFAVTSSPDLVVFLKGITICLAMLTTVLITFFDPVKRIVTGKEPRKFQSTSTGLTGLSGGQASGGVGTSLKMSGTSGDTGGSLQ